jgi:nicotinamidase/pyrazinamidase
VASSPLTPGQRDGLLVVDLQNDFVSGSLAVPLAAEVVEPLNQAIQAFAARGLPVFASRDWHPPDHCSFKAQGGIWPVHCVAGTAGADFVDGLRLPRDAILIYKATDRGTEAYSALSGTVLAAEIEARGVERLFIGGLATDYCVVNTVRDAAALGLDTVVLLDACRAVNLKPDDGARAEAEMRRAGASFASTRDVAGPA